MVLFSTAHSEDYILIQYCNLEVFQTFLSVERQGGILHSSSTRWEVLHSRGRRGGVVFRRDIEVYVLVQESDVETVSWSFQELMYREIFSGVIHVFLLRVKDIHRLGTVSKSGNLCELVSVFISSLNRSVVVLST